VLVAIQLVRFWPQPEIRPAQGCVWLARLVGRERVIAGADCGFASKLVLGQRPEVKPEIVWAKFKSLAEGARIASRQLWK